MSATDRYAIVNAICEHIEQGELVSDAAKREGTTRATLWRWTAEETEEGRALRDRYVRARSLAAAALEEEAISVARASTSETAAGDRVLIDTLKWAAAKRRPDEYGDKQRIEHAGSVAHLHLDAFRRVDASARIAHDAPKLLPSTDIEDATSDAY